MLNSKNALHDNLPAVSLLLLIIIIWEAIVRIASIPAYILPTPSAIAMALFESRSLLLMHTRVTFTAVAAGLMLALIIAVIAALLMNQSTLVKKALYPILVISQAVPIFALAPLILIWFGAGLMPKIIIVALVCFFPLAVSLVEGLNQVDPEMLELMQTMQANRLMVLKTVEFPATLPYFFSGLKIAVTYSVLGAIIGEWLAARAGLGIFMLRAMQSFQTSRLFAAIAVVVILSLALFKLTDLLSNLAMPWRKDDHNFSER